MKALLLVDIQNDFLPGGTLAVPKGDEIISLANNLINHDMLVIATKDWHPEDHISFAANHAEKETGDLIYINQVPQMLWPIHCIQNTKGADFPENLNYKKIAHTVHKGTNSQIDSYSGFFDNARKTQTSLHELLQEKKVQTLFIMGLATDYCVKHTVIDACLLNYETYLIKDGCRGVETSSGDIEKALVEMQRASAKITHSKEVLSLISTKL